MFLFLDNSCLTILQPELGSLGIELQGAKYIHVL